MALLCYSDESLKLFWLDHVSTYLKHSFFPHFAVTTQAPRWNDICLKILFFTWNHKLPFIHQSWNLQKVINLKDNLDCYSQKISSLQLHIWQCRNMSNHYVKQWAFWSVNHCVLIWDILPQRVLFPNALLVIRYSTSKLKNTDSGFAVYEQDLELCRARIALSWTRATL